MIELLALKGPVALLGSVLFSSNILTCGPLSRPQIFFFDFGSEFVEIFECGTHCLHIA
jgi:hypothetical protein